MGSYNFSRLRALVVDDDPNMRTILRMTLEACGFKSLKVASNGPQGYEIVQSFRPDLVITDWEMRGGNGIDLLRQVRTDPASPDQFLPVVVLSGYAYRTSINEARDAGATDFLVKPVSAKRVVARITGLIENPRPFIQTPDFFGPDRRQRADPDYDGPNNRTTAPVDAALDELEFEAPGADDELAFEDQPSTPKLFRPPNKLVDTLGPLDGPDPEMLLARIEAGIAGLKKKYMSWAEADLKALYRALDAARLHLGDAESHVRSIGETAHAMRGQAGTFGYPLITEIGNSLCGLTERARNFGAAEIEALELHVRAIHTVIEGGIEGDGGETERVMLAGLHAVTARLEPSAKL
ncbi:MAG TPA: response regulator [Alphaproteobacteria bacterium]|nr:response regulator [Alphaproteobacteria bacterium]